VGNLRVRSLYFSSTSRAPALGQDGIQIVKGPLRVWAEPPGTDGEDLVMGADTQLEELRRFIDAYRAMPGYSR